MSVKHGFNQTNSLLRSYPWKNYSHFNWNGLLKCPKKFYLIKTCALISNSLFYSNELVTYTPAVNTQCQSNMASQWDKYCAHVRGKIKYIFNWNGLFTCPKIYLVWLKLAFSSRKYPNTALNFDVFGNSQHSMLVKHGFNQTIITLISRLGIPYVAVSQTTSSG